MLSSEHYKNLISFRNLRHSYALEPHVVMATIKYIAFTPLENLEK